MVKYALLTFFLFSTPAFSQILHKETMTYDSLVGSPNATLNEIKWLAGHWVGEALGGITEEIWSPPLGNSMMGAFKLSKDNAVIFYELVTIVEENQSLILRLKHFNSQLKGWEEKNKTIDFRLVKVTPSKIFFDEFTIEKVSPSEINAYVVIGSKNDLQEVKFNYHRKGL